MVLLPFTTVTLESPLSLFLRQIPSSGKRAITLRRSCCSWGRTMLGCGWTIDPWRSKAKSVLLTSIRATWSSSNCQLSSAWNLMARSKARVYFMKSDDRQLHSGLSVSHKRTTPRRLVTRRFLMVSPRAEAWMSPSSYIFVREIVPALAWPISTSTPSQKTTDAGSYPGSNTFGFDAASITEVRDERDLLTCGRVSRCLRYLSLSVCARTSCSVSWS